MIVTAIGLTVRASAQSGLSNAQYRSGQNVAPVFEGWLKNADGSFDLVFGYLNRNYEEQPEIPVGPDNSFSPGARRSRSADAFLSAPSAVHVQDSRAGGFRQAGAHLDADARRANRKGRRPSGARVGAHRSRLQPEPARAGERRGKSGSEPAADHLDRWRNGDRGSRHPGRADGLGQRRRQSKAAGDVRRRSRARTRAASLPPLVTGRFGPVQQQIVQPSRGGLAVTWTHWRGPGQVTFDPTTMVVKDGKASTRATFSQPGTYVVRAYADDGAWFEPADVTVTVTAAAPSVGK